MQLGLLKLKKGTTQDRKDGYRIVGHREDK